MAISFVRTLAMIATAVEGETVWERKSPKCRSGKNRSSASR